VGTVRTDRRVRRTQGLLQRALLSLVQEQGYEREGCNLANPRLGRLFVLGPFAVRPVGALRSE
jgi:hypothetical protein